MESCMKTDVVTGYRYYIFPFEEVDKGEEIILYGFGQVGQQYYWQIRSTGYCKIKYVVDRNYKDISIEGIEVIPVEQLKACGNRIVISVRNGRENIMEMLRQYGIREGDIIAPDASIILPVNTNNAYTVAEDIHITKEEYIIEHGQDAYDQLKQIKKCLKVYTVSGSDKCSLPGYVRVGNESDGGYIMIDTILENSEKIAYSFGIADDVSWDSDMADKGYDIYMYDHTINSLPCEKDSFHFFKKGISDIAKAYGDLETLGNLIEKNDHLNKKSMILKMDVEGAEYGFLNSTDSGLLMKFDQMVLELHDLLKTDGRIERLNAIKKLLKTHVPIHIHANNLGGAAYIDQYVFADCIELTLVNRDNYKELRVASENELYLSGLDRPCWSEREEIKLSDWNEELL